MKKFLLFILLSFTSIAFGQNYQLLPDSCTFCLFLSSTGGNTWESNGYEVDPTDDTLFAGNNYMKISSSQNFEQPFAFRQDGNKLMGIVQDSINEFLIMDFDAQVGDTINNLYSEGIFYNAEVLSEDSVLVNGGVYHHFMQLRGIGYYNQGWWQDYSWELTWNERALCGWNGTGGSGEDLGGVIFNVPFDFYVISVPYAFPGFCTTDILYTNPVGLTCENCIPETNSLSENSNANFELFPNPTNDLIQLRFNDFTEKEITICDLAGNIMSSEITSLGEVVISLKDFAGGVYLIEVKSDHFSGVKRIVKY